MRIKEVSQKTGLSIHTLRYYEKIGLIDDRLVSRTENNYRDYADGIVGDLHIVKSAQRAGFTLAEIIGLMKGGKINTLSRQSKIDLLVNKLEELDGKILEINRIRDLLMMKISKLEQAEESDSP